MIRAVSHFIFRLLLTRETVRLQHVSSIHWREACVGLHVSEITYSSLKLYDGDFKIGVTVWKEK